MNAFSRSSIRGYLSSPSRRQVLLLFVGVLLPLCLFGYLAETIAEHESFALDGALLQLLHHHATARTDAVMLFFTRIGSSYFVLPAGAVVLAVLAWRRRWGDALFWVFAIGGAYLLDFLAKHAFNRVRPALWLSIAPETTYSFPSGHAMQTTALVAALAVLAWPAGWRWIVIFVGACFVLLVGMSRVYLGVHFPSDVLAGWLASLAWVVGLAAVARPVPSRQRMNGCAQNAPFQNGQGASRL